MKRKIKVGKQRQNFSPRNTNTQKKTNAKARRIKVIKKCVSKPRRKKKRCKNKTLLRTAQNLCTCKQCIEKSDSEGGQNNVEGINIDFEVCGKKSEEKERKLNKRKSNRDELEEAIKWKDETLTTKFSCKQLRKSLSTLQKAPPTSAKADNGETPKSSKGVVPIRLRTGKKSKSLLKYVLKQQNVKELTSHDKCSCCQKCISKLMRFIKVEIARQGCMWWKKSPSSLKKTCTACNLNKLNKFNSARTSGKMSQDGRTNKNRKRKSFRRRRVTKRKYIKKQGRRKKFYDTEFQKRRSRYKTKQKQRKSPRKWKRRSNTKAVVEKVFSSTSNRIEKRHHVSEPSPSTGGEAKDTEVKQNENSPKSSSSNDKSAQTESTIPDVSAGVPEKTNITTTYEENIPDNYLPKRNRSKSRLDFNMHLPDGENRLKNLSEKEDIKKPIPVPSSHGDQYWSIKVNYKKSLKKLTCKLADVQMKDYMVKLNNTTLRKTHKQNGNPFNVTKPNAKNHNVTNNYKLRLIPAVSAGTSMPVGKNIEDFELPLKHSDIKVHPGYLVSKNPIKLNQQKLKSIIQVEDSNNSKQGKDKNSKKPKKEKKLKPKIIKITRKTTKNCKTGRVMTKRKIKKTKSKIRRLRYIRKRNPKIKKRKKVRTVAIKSSSKAKVTQTQKGKKSKQNIGSKWKLLTDAVIKRLKSAIQRRLVKNNDVNRKVQRKKIKPRVAPMPRAGKSSNEDSSCSVSDNDLNISIQSSEMLEFSGLPGKKMTNKPKCKRLKVPCPSARIPTFIAMIKTALRDLAPFGLTGKKAIAK